MMMFLGTVDANRKPEDDTTTKTFVMGLPKSGSHAIHSFIQCLNPAASRPPLASAHYCCDPQRDSTPTNHPSSSSFPCEKPLMPCGNCLHAAMWNDAAAHWSEACGNYDVYAAFFVESTRPYSYFLPQHFLLPYFVSPRGKVTWILNTRASPERWAAHAAHWYSITKRLLKAFGSPYYASDINAKVYLPSPDVTTAGLQEALDASFERMHNRTDHLRRLEVLQQIYSNHTRKIQDFVQRYNRRHSPDEKQKIQLYHIDVDDAVSAPTLLAKALGYDTGSSATVALIEQCWTFNATQLDNDWQDFSIGPGTFA
jgi:hypothetical protein